MADPPNNDSVPGGGNFWPPSAASGNDDSLQLGGPESWATPWDYSVNGPLLYGSLAPEAIQFGLPDFARAARYYAAARDAADPDGSFGPGAGQNDWARYLSGGDLSMSGDTLSGDGTSGSSGNPASAGDTISQREPMPTPPTSGVPGFIDTVNGLSDAGPNAKRSYLETQRWEGDTPDPRDPGAPSVAGITLQTLRSLQGQGSLPDVTPGTFPQDLTPDQWASVYHAYADDAFNGIGGHDVLESISHPGVASFVFDSLFREGGPVATNQIQNAINEGLKKVHEAGISTVDDLHPDGVFGSGTRDALNDAIQTPAGREAFAEKLKQLRNDAHPEDIKRDLYFYNRATQGN